jgi:hypothetical protein
MQIIYAGLTLKFSSKEIAEDALRKNGLRGYQRYQNRR